MARLISRPAKLKKECAETAVFKEQIREIERKQSRKKALRIGRIKDSIVESLHNIFPDATVLILVDKLLKEAVKRWEEGLTNENLEWLDNLLKKERKRLEREFINTNLGWKSCARRKEKGDG